MKYATNMGELLSFTNKEWILFLRMVGRGYGVYDASQYVQVKTIGTYLEITDLSRVQALDELRKT